MENRRQKFLFAALFCLCLSIVGFRLAAPDSFAIWMRVMPSERIVTINDTEWKQLVNWDFEDGHFPDAWGWGDFELEGGHLVLRNPDGDWAVYFTPLEHAGDFILETEFQIEPGPSDGPSEAHLITRDSRELNSECGIAMYANDSHGYMRNTVRGTHHFKEYVDLGQTIDAGAWHRARLQNLDGRVTAWVNGVEVASSQEQYPSTLYTEPHFAARNSTVRYRNIKILSKMRDVPLAGRHAPNDLLAGLQPWRTYPVTMPGNRPLRGSARSSRSGALTSGLTGGSANADWSPSLALWQPITGNRPASFSGVQPPPLPDRGGWPVLILKIFFGVIIALVCFYIIRHFVFTINRLTGHQRHPYLDIDTVEWPEVTVMIPAHNEEEVIAEVLEALLEVDYPAGRMKILPINDRSEDGTRDIIDRIAAENPGRIKPFHRTDGEPGKAAALRDAMELIDDEFVLIFDADYIPGTGLIKQLMAPFFDPEVGAVMGRVVPHNVGENLLTRMLDLERAGGYQVDQQARMNLRLVPQYGGTVGGLRVKALEAVGGWRTDSLAEDTDATYRLLLGGWKTVYQNRSECYEQVPDTWSVRMSQIFRWTLGHNQTLSRYFFKMFTNRRTRFAEKLDGLMLLGIYWMSPAMMLGWLVGGALWYLGINKAGLIIILSVTTYSAVGNFAVFFEIATAAHLDGTRGRIRLLPFVLMGFLVSLVSVTRATLTQILGLHGRDGIFWHKTKHKKREA
jgi:cellulose synthase/poly-beta-1,6-N-acetylglucosamine synthase-like glycosyltransferase